MDDSTRPTPTSAAAIFSASTSTEPHGAEPSTSSGVPNVDIGLSILQFGPVADRIVAKMNSTHLTALIEQSGEDDRRRSAERSRGRTIAAVLAVFLLTFLFGLCWLFLAYQKSELLQGIIGLVVGAFGGGGVGFTAGVAYGSKGDRRVA
jgi:MFS family permease